MTLGSKDSLAQAQIQKAQEVKVQDLPIPEPTMVGLLKKVSAQYDTIIEMLKARTEFEEDILERLNNLNTDSSGYSIERYPDDLEG